MNFLLLNNPDKLTRKQQVEYSKNGKCLLPPNLKLEDISELWTNDPDKKKNVVEANKKAVKDLLLEEVKNRQLTIFTSYGWKKGYTGLFDDTELVSIEDITERIIKRTATFEIDNCIKDKIVRDFWNNKLWKDFVKYSKKWVFEDFIHHFIFVKTNGKLANQVIN